MADSINSLPTDKNAPTHPELQIVDYLFEKDGSQQKIGGVSLASSKWQFSQAHCL